MERKTRIGITINVSDPYESLFTNGIRQNIIILRELYEKCENVEKAYIVNVAGNQIPREANCPLSQYAEHFISISEVKEKCDLLVVCHGSLHDYEYADFAKSGIKIVKQVLGAQQSIFTETVLFKDNDKAFGIYKKNNHVKKIWISEHFYDREKYFHEALYDCEVVIAPYVWDPRFIEEYAKLQNKLNNTDSFYKASNTKEKRLGVFEPNINYVKNAMIPTLITQKFYKKYPELLKHSYIFNTKNLRTKKDFIDFCKDLEAHKDKKLSFQDSYSIMYCLGNFVDVVLSHQDGCALNYLYLDAAWFGYPVVHNSHLLKQLGWYYPENNVDIAVEHLKDIAENFDNSHKEYLEKSRKFIKKFMINNKKNIAGYTKLIEEAMR